MNRRAMNQHPMHRKKSSAPGFRWPDLLCLLGVAWAGLWALPAATAPPPTAAASALSSLPSDTPENFRPNTDNFDYVKREEMIAMRDGVKLQTFILIPKGATGAPMLLARTPYNAAEAVMNFNSSHLAAAVPQMCDSAVAAGYIIVLQDVRGKYGSEGDYVMTRPLAGPRFGRDRTRLALAQPIAVPAHVFIHAALAFEYQRAGHHIVEKGAVVADQQQCAGVFGHHFFE